jgi:hypothetical protein
LAVAFSSSPVKHLYREQGALHDLMSTVNRVCRAWSWNSLQDGASKIVKLPYKWFNYGLW